MIKLPKIKKAKSHAGNIWLIGLAIILIITIAGIWTLRVAYQNNLNPVSTSQKTVYFTVSLGDTKHVIAVNLQRAGLIRNSRSFEIYVRSSEFDNLQAGTYSFSPSMGAKQIAKAMVKGDVAKNLLTILPAQRLDQIKQAFIKSGYSSAEVEAAFNPATYSGHPALASLPKGASLEGYLYPDSFQKQADTPASTIVRESLDEMQKYLTSDVINGFGAQGLNVFQGITLASIVEQESSNPADQPMVAQVFIKRLNQGMMLGSDVTAFYASALASSVPSVSTDSPYNTRLYTGLPPGPIGNVNANALKAVAHPATTDYLYFVAGDDNVLHFSHTQAEHEAAVSQYCTKACH